MAIYLDYAATAPLKPAILDAVAGYLSSGAGNPSSLHGHGRAARMALETAREQCAEALGARVEEIVFTSGATEANNLALWGVMSLAQPGSRLLISAVEHPSVRDYAHSLARHGYQVAEIPVGAQGRVHPRALAALLDAETALVSVMAVNNEVGTVQPIEELAALCREHGVLFHTDAVQGLPSPGSADLVSVSGHKLGGLPGGLLLVRKGLKLAPMLIGGSQEDSRRAGTSNVAAAVSLGLALAQRAGEAERLGRLRERFEARVRRVPGASLLGAAAERAPHISAWLFGEIPAEALLVRLDLAGISASSGSACSSHSLDPSHVLLAMGYSEKEALRLVRFSFGHATTEQDVDQVAEALPGLVGGLVTA